MVEPKPNSNAAWAAEHGLTTGDHTEEVTLAITAKPNGGRNTMADTIGRLLDANDVPFVRRDFPALIGDSPISEPCQTILTINTAPGIQHLRAYPLPRNAYRQSDCVDPNTGAYRAPAAVGSLNTDLTDLSDVKDEAIEAAIRVLGWAWTVPSAQNVRDDPKGYKSTILLARCIQAHYPDMIVDPVTLKAREFFASRHKAGAHDLMVGAVMCKHGAAEEYILRGDFDKHGTMLLITAAMRHALAGMAMRGEG